MKSVGVYIHVPYCRQKCNYCDFYSLANPATATAYTEAVVAHLGQMANRYPDKTADTIYLGGGTPTMLSPDCLRTVLDAAKEQFRFTEGEITCEINPGAGYPTTVEDLAAMGVNRLSVGMQSAIPEELSALGRKHSPDDVKQLLERARRVGITNCSVDCMWGIPGQTVESALQTVDFALSLAPTHISAYLLKIEADTPFGKHPPVLPDEDTVCDIYTACYERLERAGYLGYEISNFAKAGFESRHNRKYWDCHDTIGIGPAAHSFVDGKRFYYERDLAGFMAGNAPILDGEGGNFTEYAMLQLRLKQGLQQAECMARFGQPIPAGMLQKAAPLIAHGLMELDEQGLRITVQGNLVSNEILATIL